MDITTDGFGFMLSIGDLTWVPFVYSLQARYLVFNQLELGYFWTAVIIGCNLLGYYIFRAANGEKNDFRNGRNPKSEYFGLCTNLDAVCGSTRKLKLMLRNNLDLQYFTTKSGSKLIISGWWGASRHPNYLYAYSSPL